MLYCESLAHCLHHVIDLEPEGTYLDGKIVLVKHRCKMCGRLWAEVYLESGITVQLDDDGVELVDYHNTNVKHHVSAAHLQLLENVHTNDLNVSDTDARDREEDDR